MLYTLPDDIIAFIISLVNRGDIYTISKRWFNCSLRLIPNDLRQLRFRINMAGSCSYHPAYVMRRAQAQMLNCEHDREYINDLCSNKHLLTRLHKVRDCATTCNDWLCACMFSLPEFVDNRLVTKSKYTWVRPEVTLPEDVIMRIVMKVHPKQQGILCTISRHWYYTILKMLP